MVSKPTSMAAVTAAALVLGLFSDAVSTVMRFYDHEESRNSCFLFQLNVPEFGYKGR
jgi:hypothetical protein